MENRNQTTATLKALQRGELAATETYQQAMEKFGADPEMIVLRQMHEEHRETANDFRKLVREHGGEPEQDSGSWGDWAKLLEGSAAQLGRGPALAALKAGEELGLNTYEKTLQERALPDNAAHFVREKALPQTRAHIDALARLLEQQSDVGP